MAKVPPKILTEQHSIFTCSKYLFEVSIETKPLPCRIGPDPSHHCRTVSVDHAYFM